jgi:hypothetical protein
MRILAARRVLSADRRGSSWPVLVETEDGLQFTKLRGAAQGTGALVAEVIVAELAEALGLLVPSRSLVRLDPEVESVDRNDELADLLRVSAGVNLGFAYLDDARSFVPADDVHLVRQRDVVAILWLDGLTTNPDRTARNPNLLWWRDALWLIDHGAALGFQYALPAVDVAAARRPYTLRGDPHVLQSRRSDAEMGREDEAFADAVTPTVIERAVAAVPDEFLVPLLGQEASPDALRNRRTAYVDFLTRRLEAPRPFLAPVVVPNEQRRRGRPDWLERRP